MYSSEKHNRRSIRLPLYNYSKPGFYFITLCTWKKECLFGTVHNNNMSLNVYGEAAPDLWSSLPNRFEHVVLDEYVVMPNHIHGILEIRNDSSDQKIHMGESSVGAIHELPLTSRTVLHGDRAIRELPLQNQKIVPDHLKRRRMIVPKVAGYFKMNAAREINRIRNVQGIPVWQRSYYDHIIRNEEERNSIREYIRNNPVSWDKDNYYAD